MKTTVKPPQNKRLLALDILRGITIAGMLLVNNPGSWSHIYAPLEHAQWNGLTPTDLVFPFFMFIMGVSTYFSLRKYNYRFSTAAIIKIVRRTIVIFLIGWLIAWFSRFMSGIRAGKALVDCVFTFEHMRILGVMPRLAICYGVGSVLALWLHGKRKPIGWCAALILVAYSIILICGNGYAFSESNIIYQVDTAVLGENHLYSDTINGITLHFDPEGLLSTLPAIAHMLIGFICGSLIMEVNDNRVRINRLFIIGTILTFAGFLLAYGLPLNKKIWSPTFAITTCGLAASFLALLIWFVDMKGHKNQCRFFEVFGINPLFLYCLGAILSICLASYKGTFYADVLTPLCGGDQTLASLCFALLFVLLNWFIGLMLYKKKIYIKI